MGCSTSVRVLALPIVVQHFSPNLTQILEATIYGFARFPVAYRIEVI